jgi:hexosaminidase
MNYFHWHLTEDQGWRIEIKKYPLLTEVGSCRSGTIIGHAPGTGDDSTEYCGYYTQDQIRDIVKYAATAISPSSLRSNCPAILRPR